MPFSSPFDIIHSEFFLMFNVESDIGKKKNKESISLKTYKLVQSSVHIDGLFGEFGPANVSPHRIPLHELICKLHDLVFNHGITAYYST
jgi:hypothetical protein